MDPVAQHFTSDCEPTLNQNFLLCIQKELWYLILALLPYTEILRFARVSRTAREFCTNLYFWKLKVMRDIPSVDLAIWDSFIQLRAAYELFLADSLDVTLYELEARTRVNPETNELTRKLHGLRSKDTSEYTLDMFEKLLAETTEIEEQIVKAHEALLERIRTTRDKDNKLRIHARTILPLRRECKYYRLVIGNWRDLRRALGQAANRDRAAYGGSRFAMAQELLLMRGIVLRASDGHIIGICDTADATIPETLLCIYAKYGRLFFCLSDKEADGFFVLPEVLSEEYNTSEKRDAFGAAYSLPFEFEWEEDEPDYGR
jgi:hypothetical protein